MINKSYFKKLQSEYDKNDGKREELIRRSRDVIKLSKHLIYSVHRKDMKNASTFTKKIEKDVKKLSSEIKKHPEVETGAYRNAVQEYVEAICYYRFVKDGKIPTGDELKVSGEHYLLGVCDLVGELMRLAINSGIEHKYDVVYKVKKFVDEIYDELMKFDFRNSELRKKTDGIKWELKKIDDMMFTIENRNKK